MLYHTPIEDPVGTQHEQVRIMRKSGLTQLSHTIATFPLQLRKRCLTELSVTPL